MEVGFLTFDKDRSDKTGSARIRAYNLIKHAENFHEFRAGPKYDAVIFQKFYWPQYAELYQGIKVLDICDPDWLAGSATLEFRRMLEAMDGVVCNTVATADYIRKLTKKPVIVIPDRHDIEIFKVKKQHKGRAKSAVWFGYSHNAHILEKYAPKLEELGLKLTIISEKFVRASKTKDEKVRANELFVQWPKTVEEVNEELIKHDIALLPVRRRPQDQFKSNNKETHAWCVGLPVANFGDDIEKYMEAPARTEDQEIHFDTIREAYDCKHSVYELTEFLKRLEVQKYGRS